nr:MAG TPA: hypothetical protein [Caudoviricetes sp.]
MIWIYSFHLLIKNINQLAERRLTITGCLFRCVMSRNGILWE